MFSSTTMQIKPTAQTACVCLNENVYDHVFFAQKYTDNIVLCILTIQMYSLNAL